MTVHVSVAVCTRNRAASLRRTLERMTTLSLPPGTAWELLVVDNASTDDTESVLAAFAERLPLRILHATRPGLSHARNVAIDAADGTHLVWTDDDVLVDHAWLAEYVAAFTRWPEAVVFGGPIRPVFEGTPPPWLSRVLPRIETAYATRDLGPTPIPLTAHRRLLPFGANYAIRADEQRRVPYDPHLGRRPRGDAPLGEETAVMCTLLAAGATGWWVPGAQVQHVIPPERQTVRYLRTYFFGLGQFYGRRGERIDGPRWFGRPRFLWRQAVEREVAYRFKRLVASPERWIDDLIVASQSWGQLRSRPHRPHGPGEAD